MMKRRNCPGSRENVDHIIKSHNDSSLAKDGKRLSSAERKILIDWWQSTCSSSNVIRFETAVLRQKVALLLGLRSPLVSSSFFSDSQRVSYGKLHAANWVHAFRDGEETFAEYTERVERDAYDRQVRHHRMNLASVGLSPLQVDETLHSWTAREIADLKEELQKYIKDLREFPRLGVKSPIYLTGVDRIIDFLFHRSSRGSWTPVRAWGRPGSQTASCTPFKLEDQWRCADEAVSLTGLTLEEAEKYEMAWKKLSQREQRGEAKERSVSLENAGAVDGN